MRKTREFLAGHLEKAVLRVAMFAHPPTMIEGVQYLALLGGDVERRALVHNTVTRSLKLIRTGGKENVDLFDMGLRLIVSAEKRRGRPFLLEARGYISEFRPPESGNEVLLALNLIWCANHCRRYHQAKKRGRGLDWGEVGEESRKMLVSFAKSRFNAADWLEYIDRHEDKWRSPDPST